MSLAWFLATRFRAQALQGSSRFIKNAAVTGIALGCCVLIVLLSVLNGFEQALKTRLLASIPHAELFAVENNGLPDVTQSVMAIKQQQGVTNAFAYSKASAMLQRDNQLDALQLLGLPLDSKQHPLFEFRTDYAQNAISDAAYPLIFLGKQLIANHQYSPGDTVELLLPNPNDPNFRSPQLVRFTLGGELYIGGGADNIIGLVDLTILQSQLELTHAAQGIQIYYDDPFAAQAMTYQIGYQFPYPVYMSDWTRTHGHLYQDILLVEFIVYLVLGLVIAVACFNIVVTLMMTVKHKQKQIAILKTMGIARQVLVYTFVLSGLQSALTGIVVGCVFGIMIAMNLSHGVQILQNALDVSLFSADVYFVDALPAQLLWSDVWLTALIALILALLATYYPAKKAANIVAAEHLH